MPTWYTDFCQGLPSPLAFGLGLALGLALGNILGLAGGLLAAMVLRKVWDVGLRMLPILMKGLGAIANGHGEKE